MPAPVSRVLRTGGQERYAQAAVLFRAAARAEEIHLTNHAAVIRQLGAVPRGRIEKPVIPPTMENLAQSARKRGSPLRGILTRCAPQAPFTMYARHPVRLPGTGIQ
jgi:hypothetical protein